MKKGQVSLEYMLVVGLLFLMIIPLLIIYAEANKDTTDILTESQLRKAGVTLRDAAERVYYAGEPAQEKVELYFPDHIINVTLTNTSLTFTVDGGAGTYDLPISSTAPLNGTVGNSRGVHVITVRAVNGTVQVSE